MPKRKTGRKKGSRTQGYWFRKGRGWVVGPHKVPLKDADGNHIKSREAKEEAAAAYQLYLLRSQRPSSGNDQTPVMEVCRLYLDHLARRPNGKSTYEMRRRFLFDFATGFPARFADCPEKATPKDRIHDGYGAKPVGELTIPDVEDWVSRHRGWTTNRAPVQAVRAAIMYAVKARRISANPIRGIRIDPPRERILYFTPDQEQAMYEHTKPAFRQALQVCVRTGARPIAEFGVLEARHVEETPQGQVWRFPPEQNKKRKGDRVIFVAPEIAEIVRQQMKEYPTGPLFRNSRGTPWKEATLKEGFKRLRERLKKKGIMLDPKATFYATRHTFAKRMLGGYWGQATTLEILAGMMGNTPDVCYKYYSKWCEKYTDPMWAAVNGKT